jgi:hypothetical protein
MALETGGLDAQVEQRMDAYRGNPQKLQQRYGQNKELLDLLALQKLTSEKKQVAANMQLQAQQNPNTIAQQREQEALELTKQEMGGTLGQLAANTKGTLDQKAAMQKKNMNRMAQNASRPQPGPGAGLMGLMGGGARPPARPPMGNPQAGGLANARMAQAAAQGGPVRMAQGGIVSFVEGQEVNSPAYRKYLELKQRIGKDMALQQLRQNVKTKYGTFASPFGALRQQSDEQRAYAKQVLAQADSMDEQQLFELANTNFTAGMSPDDLSTLPPLDISTAPEDVVIEDSGVAPVVTSDQADADPTLERPETGNVTFMPAEQEDFFKDVPTSYEPVTPKEADKTGLNTAVTAMTDQAGSTPVMAAVSDLEAAPLESVEAPRTDSEQKLFDELTQRYVSDSNEDVQGALTGARASSDDYFKRDDKADIYAGQETEERALQAETLDPDRLRKLARIQTLAGGRRGSGGIGAAYAATQLGQDKRRSEGLGTIRDIQDLGVTTDTGIASYGAAAGQSAATRAENRRTTGMSGLQGILDDSQTRALQGQREQNAVNIENKRYEQDVAKGNFNAARDAINNQAASLRKVVSLNADDVNNQVKVNLSVAGDENQARSDALEAKLEVAKAKSEERLKLNEKLFNSEVELQKLADARAKTVTTLIAESMNNNPQAVALERQLLRLSKTENRVEYEQVETELNKIKRATIETLSGMFSSFADNYTDMITLNNRIQQIRAANTSVQSTPRRLDPSSVTMDEIPSGP